MADEVRALTWDNDRIDVQVCAVSVDRDQRGVELGLDEPAERERFSVRQARGKVPEAHGAGTTQTRVPS